MAVRTREFLATDALHIDRIALTVEERGSEPDLSIIPKTFIANQIFVTTDPLNRFGRKALPTIGTGRLT